MGRFDAEVAALRKQLSRGLASGRIRPLPLPADARWPAGRSFVLARDAALDLGSPAVGSVGLMLWASPEERSAAEPRGHLYLEGPDLPALAARGPAPRPFAQAVLVHGDPPDDYEGYLDLKEALHDLELEGVALRSLPSQSHLWCRIHADALARGFDLSGLGAGVVSALTRLDFVDRVDVLFCTAGREALAPYADLAARAARVVGALIKRHEEEHAECDECEYRDICDERAHDQGAAAP